MTFVERKEGLKREAGKPDEPMQSIVNQGR